MTKHTTWEELKKEMLNSKKAKNAYEKAESDWKLKELLVEVQKNVKCCKNC